jgi:dTDP-4-dehydrorhamnose reductase
MASQHDLSSTTRVLLTGATGQLGSYLLRELRQRDLTVESWSSREGANVLGLSCRHVDLRDVDRVSEAFREFKPDIVIHAAAVSSAAACLEDPTRARQVNSTATRVLAELAQKQHARLVFTSTDLVFDGRQGNYRETDAATPISVYGHSKAAAERCVVHCENQLALRISLLFAPSINGRPVFFDHQLEAVQQGSRCFLFEDEWRTPLSTQLAAEGILRVAETDIKGILHLAGPESISRFDMGQRLAKAIGVDPALVIANRRDDSEGDEPRPRDVSLCCDQWCNHFPDFPRLSYEESLRALGVGKQDALPFE